MTIVNNQDEIKRMTQAMATVHASNPYVKQFIDGCDWDGIWPEIDSDGYMTGNVVDSDAPHVLVDYIDGEFVDGSNFAQIQNH